jgi:hypothetical protein
MDFAKLLAIIPRKMLVALICIYLIEQTAKGFGITATMPETSWQSVVLMTIVLLGQIFLSAYSILLHYRGSLANPVEDVQLPELPK